MFMPFVISFLLVGKLIFAIDYHYPSENTQSAPQIKNLENACDAFNSYNASLNEIIFKNQFKNILSEINDKIDVIPEDEKFDCGFECSLKKVSPHFWCLLMVYTNEPTYYQSKSNKMCFFLNDVGFKKFQRVVMDLRNFISIFKAKSETLTYLNNVINFTYNKTFEFVLMEYYEGQYTMEMNEKFDSLGRIRNKLIFKINEAQVDIETIQSKLSHEMNISNEIITSIKNTIESSCSVDGIKNIERLNELANLCRKYLKAHGHSIPTNKEELHKFYVKQIRNQFKAMD